MRSLKNLTLSMLFLLFSTVSFCQYFTTGVYSGVSFSNIHGEEAGGRWKAKSGPVQGFSLGYNISRTFGFETGLGFYTIYYEHKTLPPLVYPIDYYLHSGPYDMIAPTYYLTSDKMDFRYIRMPVLLTVSIPSALRFNMKAGLYFSFLQDYDLTEYYNASYTNAKHYDFGYMFSSGVSYPLSDKIVVGLNVNYTTGRKHFLPNSNLRNGASEFALNFNYEFLKKNEKDIIKTTGTDTSKKVTVTYKAGLNVSWNRLDEERSRYSSITGPSLGFNIDFDLGGGFAFVSGVSFERKGYSLKDSSELYYRYLDRHHAKSFVDSKVLIDYAVVPLMMRIPIGNSLKIFVNTGPWIGLRLNSRNVGVAYKDSRQNSNYNLIKTTIYDDFSRYVKDTDMGWLINAQVSLPVFKTYRVDLDVQYSLGYENIFDDSTLPATQDPYIVKHVIRNRTLSFVLGFTLPSTW